MSIDAKRRLAAAAFVALLAFSVFWPAPAIDINQLCCHAHLAVDDLSFLGREAPAWDIAFWCISGLFLLALLHPSNAYKKSDFAEIWQLVRATRIRLRKTDAMAVIFAAILVAIVWRFADAPITAWAERVQSANVQDTIRIANRFGGGMNPAMVVVFFLVAGVVYRTRRWIAYGVAMALAGAAAGVSVQIVAATSFPSGHTVGAFALAGVLMLASPSRTMRVIAFLLALSVAVSRVMAFRHWTSDVLASAAIGMILAVIAVRGVVGRERSSADDADIRR